MTAADQLLTEAMLLLASQPSAVFVGQGVAFGGVATYRHLEGVPAEQRVEFPVAEEAQLGFCTGLALMGWLPVCVFPRIDFMLRAADQLVNHLDKLETMSRGDFCPKVIIRTRVGTRKPLDAGPQHTNDFSQAFRLMLTTVRVITVDLPERIISSYQEALTSTKSTLVVERL